jgi:molybdate transport system ATP-binding protein
MIVLAVDVEKKLGAFKLAARFEAAGGVTALFGPSGAGKTTVVNMIAGLLTPDRGAIALNATTLFDAANGINVPPHRRHIGYVFQEGRLFPHLSVRQNIDYGRRMSGHPRDAEEFARIVELLGVGHLLDRRPRLLSGGERQRVAIGRALLMRPRLLLLDEPTEGIQPSIIKDIGRAITHLRQLGRIAIVLVEQYLDFARELGDRFAVMDRGTIVYACERTDVDEQALRRAMAL